MPKKIFEIHALQEIWYFLPQGSNYLQLCSRFNELSLENRRTIDDMFLFKIIRGLIASPYLLSEIPISVPQFYSREQRPFYTTRNSRTPVSTICNTYNIVHSNCNTEFNIFDQSISFFLLSLIGFFKES